MILKYKDTQSMNIKFQLGIAYILIIILCILFDTDNITILDQLYQILNLLILYLIN